MILSISSQDLSIPTIDSEWNISRENNSTTANLLCTIRYRYATRSLYTSIGLTSWLLQHPSEENYQLRKNSHVMFVNVKWVSWSLLTRVLLWVAFLLLLWPSYQYNPGVWPFWCYCAKVCSTNWNKIIIIANVMHYPYHRVGRLNP